MKKAVGPTPPPGEPPAPRLGPPAVVSLPAPSDRLVAALAQLRERTGAAAAAAAPPPAAPAAAAPEPEPRPPSRFAEHVGKKLAQIFDAATDALIETLPGKLRRKPGEADESDLEDFETAAAEIVHRWVPDIQAGPYGKLALAGVFIVGGKWVDGEPMSRPALAAVPAAVTNTTAAAPPPPPPPAPPAEPAAIVVAGGF